MPQVSYSADAHTYDGADRGERRLRKQPSLGGRFAEHVFGYHSVREKAYRVPEGFNVHFSRDGRPYLLRLSETDANDKEAVNEHKRVHLPLSCSREELGRHFGVGIYLFFDFLWFLCWTNAFLVLVSLGNFIPHVLYDRSDVLAPAGLDRVWDRAFLLSYISPLNSLPWVITNAVMLISSFLFGPIYSIRVKKYLRRHDLEDLDDALDVEDFIADNQRISRKSKVVRMSFSYIVFVILLAISSAVSFLIVYLANQYLGKIYTYAQYASIISAAIVAVVIVFTNFIWQRLCQYLNRLERHHTWSSFRTHLTLKYFLFKLLNVLIMYLSRWVVKRYFMVDNSASTVDCVLYGVGDQFLFIILFDMTASHMWKLFSAWAQKLIGRRRGMIGEGSNDSARPQFDLADLYLSVLYRQFIIYLGMPIFPLISILGLVCNLLEYRLDKYRLLRICHHPKGMQASMKRFLTFFMFSTAFVALLSFPFGSMWLFIRYTTVNCTQLFSNTPSLIPTS
eukprot:TRINITY_DN3362_c0_g1_i2.p1 TRINITY_DN3362_c0_g1~~TRINITY_DN3362_c0_g1_i2.p1  ORF type:complete len:507 (+),score=104.12 TRINITY_DN3362_c0_g1_i2:162-1682(+)